jgi:hypothetical protein
VALLEPLRTPAFAAIFVSLAASSIGDWAARVALTALVYARTGSAAESTLVYAVSFLVWLGPGQLIAGATAHRRRKHVMVAADLVRAGLYSLVLLPLGAAELIVVVGVAALCTPPFETARSTLMAEQVPTETYPAAIALADLASQGTIIAGYLVGGAAIALGGLRVALWVNVASFLISAAALSMVAEARRDPEAAQRSPAHLRRGLSVIIHDPVLRRGIGYLSCVGAVVAASEATAVAYSRLVLGRGAGLGGVLGACVAGAMIVTVPLVPRTGSARRLLRLSAGAGAVACLVGGAFFGVGHLYGAVGGYLAVGVLAGTTTGAQVAFQPRIDPTVRVGVFALLQGYLQATQGAAAVLGGVLLEAFGGSGGELVMVGVAGACALAWVLRPVRSPCPSSTNS